jgi:hypothetical protein
MKPRGTEQTPHNMLFCGRGSGICSAPRDFDPQIADTGRSELADVGLRMEGLLEMLLARTHQFSGILGFRC